MVAVIVDHNDVALLGKSKRDGTPYAARSSCY